jgi:hypothetical protein
MSIEPTEQDNARLRSEPLLLDRSPDQIAELKNVRHSELKSISERLDNVSEVSRAGRWESRSQLTGAAAVGGAIGFLPFLAEKPSKPAALAYVAIVALAFVAAWLFSKAASDVRAERADSVAAIKAQIDNNILKTETPRLQAATRRLEPTRSVPPAAEAASPPATLQDGD